MNMMVLVTGIARLVLVCTVFLLNVRALVRQSSPSKPCLHSLLAGAVSLANLIYLASWFPYIAYCLSNGHWLVVSPRVYCLFQNFVTNALGMVLLGLLALNMVDKIRTIVYKRKSISCGQAIVATFALWIVPQLLYDLIAFTSARSECKSLVFRFLDDIAEIPAGDPGAVYKIGFMICQQELSARLLHDLLWQYLLLVLPVALTVLSSSAILLAHRIQHTAASNDSKPSLWQLTTTYPEPQKEVDKPSSAFQCSWRCSKRNRVIRAILYSNFLWHVFLRPIFILHSLGSDSDSTPTFLDFGSHVLLTIGAVFAPMTRAQEEEEEESGEGENKKKKKKTLFVIYPPKCQEGVVRGEKAGYVVLLEDKEYSTKEGDIEGTNTNQSNANHSTC